MRRPLSLLPLMLAACAAAKPAVEQARYRRVGPAGFDPECEFTLTRTGDGWSLRSVTGALRVEARYDREDRLLSAVAATADRSAVVEVAGAKARVSRAGQAPQEFDAPPGVIVTSAPDWSDAFLLCRRYDRARGGRQEFPGLWIHPVQPAQAPTFSIEPAGSDRYLIRLRNNSAYAAWADAAGRMIRLIPLPAGTGGLVLEGHEAAAAGLRP